MSDQYPSPGQPGQQPPTQVAPQGGGAPQQPYGGGAPGGGYPQQGGGYQGGAPGGGYQGGAPGGYQGGAPGGGYQGGAPGGGYPGGPGGFGAPPTSGGGGKKGLIIGIIVAVVVLVLAAAAVLAFVVLGDDDDDKKADDRSSASSSASASESESPSEEPSSESPSESFSVPTDPTTTDDGGTGVAPTGDPTVRAKQYTDALISSDCGLLEQYSTAQHFNSTYGGTSGCPSKVGMPGMSSATYQFEEPTVSEDSALVTGKVTGPGGSVNGLWLLEGDATGTEWLISGFTASES